MNTLERVAHDVQRGARPEAADDAAFVQVSLVLSPVSGHSLVNLVMTSLVQTVSRQLRHPVPWNARRLVARRTSARADVKYDNFSGKLGEHVQIGFISEPERASIEGD